MVVVDVVGVEVDVVVEVVVVVGLQGALSPVMHL